MSYSALSYSIARVKLLKLPASSLCSLWLELRFLKSADDAALRVAQEISQRMKFGMGIGLLEYDVSCLIQR